MKIPLFKQKKNTCGLTALRMVLAYFGEKITENDLKKLTGKISRYGVRTVKLSEAAKKLGFETECLSYNKLLAGSKAKIKKPDVKVVLKYLWRRIPVILAVRSSLLHNKKLTKMGHFIVIREYRNGFFHYNDPMDAKIHKIKSEEFRFAWFNNVLDSSAYFLAIWPKKSLWAHK
ncbi:MAG: hypothetical protein COT26_00570 [Candidatus Kerfeldbacteria bacterium CG08_land_8_20_14_0_20_43_14]|uniref:Peptidase C39 domain-containing protein n=1 Tax=Candidatus Kerfeldbacteria bacterium CG08_land_8_20_14_0_20_43_14 TaxID=2014246 RepID=A0A2H0YR31_9BACT|nr:MAG: hypothetical protein COT26_00570 [Candidatus Kerfeldbacteria bacterium CG08_land_8_20_14_0_20_43_14]